ncbi:hypothetical protein DFH07DRAFT_472266 [Mycena maculata]|uniref:DUF6593 domain-containing protein n=1 Tax=Mycena maculata TaxID=230809 RepID=A0AAD7J480_9AGAR|nr:hypothetical protein DFH07DRAFT_472266 [Mycena maculata]
MSSLRFWQRPGEPPQSSSSQEATLAAPVPIVLTWPDPAVPLGSPPTYDDARVPVEAVTYTLSPQGFNTLLVLPPADWPDSRPRYHIVVSLNCMNPFSFITTIHSGASDSGLFVGEFETGLSTIPGTVCLGDRQRQIKDVLRMQGHPRWMWRFGDDTTRHLRWEKLNLNNFSTGVWNCFFASDRHPAPTQLKIAQFQGTPSTGTERTQPATLRVYPPGQALFDEILISVLLVERKRLQPSPPEGSTGWWS